MAYQPGPGVSVLNPMSSGLQDSVDKRLFGGGANNRKPRVYASANPTSTPNLIPLDFAIYLQRNFDSIIEELNGSQG